jgi:glycosyltransferase involved in cell wall biosynthesis
VLTGPLVVVGTYDAEKPRARILLAGLRQRGVTVHEINVPIWRGVRDKGTLTVTQKLWAALRQVFALPMLALRYATAPAHDTVLVPYPGVFDVLAIAPIARLRGARIVWDLFISPFDTMVNDRRSHGAAHPLALTLRAAEWVAARVADVAFLDTAAHARRFERMMGLPSERIGAVPLGTDPHRFPARAGVPPRAAALRVVFYGQFIPLHGLDVIVEACAALQRDGVPLRLTLAGTGQEAERIRARIAALGLANVDWRGWVDAAALPALLHAHDVGLGIFGTSEKALTVVPNKVYEMAATQLPIVTGDTPALADFAVGHPWLMRVPPGDAHALAACLARLAREGVPPADRPLPCIGPAEVADALCALLERPR